MLKLTTVSPRTMTNPSVLFSSLSLAVSPLAPFFGFILRNSSQSAKTKFMCLSYASIVPVSCRESASVIRSL